MGLHQAILSSYYPTAPLDSQSDEAMTRIDYLGLAFYAFCGTARGIPQSSDDEDPAIVEYCEGEGSICEVADELWEECILETGDGYYECTCNSGYYWADRECEQCKEDTGYETYYTLDNYDLNCEDLGYTVAPLPSSLASQQSDRTETKPMPTATSNSDDEETTTTEVDSTTSDTFEPYTITFEGHGSVSVTLPTLQGPSETSAASRIWNSDVTLASYGLVMYFMVS